MSDIAEFDNVKSSVKSSAAKPYRKGALKIAAKSPAKPPAITERELLRLSQLWQTTLNVHSLLDLMVAELPKLVPFDSFTYFNLEQALEQRTGKGGKHSCSYKLSLQGRDLGQLELTRNTRFLEDELYTLERVLGTAINSLRNAIDYHQMAQNAYNDGLTGLLNRNALNHLLPKEIKRSQRNDVPLALLFLDLDRFKAINDRYGHQAGDHLLKQVSILLESSVRDSDSVFRYGGEEFIILLPATDLDGARRVSQKVLGNIQSMGFSLNDQTLKITTSVGVTTLQHDDAQSLIDRADQAMYQAKQSGRDRVCVK